MFQQQIELYHHEVVRYRPSVKVIKKSQVDVPRGNKMSETFDEKLEQFERLWDGVTPKGINRTKSLKFRQYMRQHVLQKYHKRSKEQFSSADKGHYNHSLSKDQFLTKENCRKYWIGENFRRRLANPNPSEAIK